MTAALKVGDLFCGAGGSSTGIARACSEYGVKLQLTAINHWEVAIATHSANHPEARHRCESVDRISPSELWPEGLDVMWASPECTEHSYAKAGKSIDDQRRTSAWVVPRLAEALRPKLVIVENVRNFLKWGPTEPVLQSDGSPKLDKDGKPVMRPIRSRIGETFSAWFAAMESLGYSGKWELLNSANYGEAQTRIRLFVVFTRAGLNYEFPAPTHGKPGTLEVARGLLKPWNPARKIIDFELASQSIFERSTPLSPNTMRRIEAGITRYCSGELADAFLVVLRNHADAQSLDRPTPTIATGGHLGLAQIDATPFIIGQHGGGVARSVDEPLSTITTDGYSRVFEPMLIDVRHGDTPHRPKSIDEPLNTITSKNGVGMVEPFLATYYGEQDGGPRVNSVEDPLPTVPTANRFGIVEPFIVPQQNGSAPTGVDEPLATVTTTSRGVRFIEPRLDPADLVEPTIAPADASAPADRVVMIDGKPFVLDIKFRMLQPSELALAQGFPRDYVFTGGKSAQTAQIGNAVAVSVAAALMRSALKTLFGEGGLAA